MKMIHMCLFYCTSVIIVRLACMGDMTNMACMGDMTNMEVWADQINNKQSWFTTELGGL